MESGPQSWGDFGEQALDRLRDEVSRWNPGDDVEFYGERFIVTPGLVEELMTALERTVRIYVAERVVAREVPPAFGFAVGLETAIRRAAVGVVGEQLFIPGSYPQTPIVHEHPCTPLACRCLNCLEWIAREARRRDPLLESEISEAALGRALKGQFDARPPTPARLRTMYGWILIDVIRMRGAVLDAEPTERTTSEIGPTMSSETSTELLGSWLLNELDSERNTDDRMLGLSDEILRAWMQLSDVGRSILFDLDSGAVAIPPALVAEGRSIQVGARATLVALYVRSADIRRSRTIKDLLRRPLRPVVGGETDAARRQRLGRVLPGAVLLVQRAVGLA